MCNDLSVLLFDFSTFNDEFNWIGQNITTDIQTVDGKLRLKPDNAQSRFKRILGGINPSKDRIRLKSNFIMNALGSEPTIHVWFALYAGSTKIDEFSVYRDNLSSGDNVHFNLDRVYDSSGLSGPLELQIRFTQLQIIPEQFENQILLEDLELIYFDYCETNIRTYFVLEDLVQNSLSSISSSFRLQEWKVDDVETLTPTFFAENNNRGANPIADWLFAKADIDGSNRVAENKDPNTFNPLEKEWGLKFDTVDSYHGKKPIGTKTGSDYGNGIMQIGFEKPEILSGNLESKDGAFFIDIDYSKNLRIVFDVLVNNDNTDVFTGPAIYRRYYILWNKNTCKKEFYYRSVIPERNSIERADTFHDGFLFGLTGGVLDRDIIACDESFNFSGQSGVKELTINLGSNTGQAGIHYNANNVPDKFEIEWNGQIYSSGYVGRSNYDSQLLSLGIPASEIKTGLPSTGEGYLYFQKTLASPAIATIRVTAPLAGTAWSLQGICPITQGQ